MPRKKRLEPDAEQVAIYLTPLEQLALNVISARRKKRQESRTTGSEIVVDGLWKILTEAEGVRREAIEDLLPVQQHQGGENIDKVKPFPKKT